MSKKKATKTAAGARLPQLRTKKNRGAATCYATFNGQKVWFGRADDPETQERFGAFLGQWLANGQQLQEEPEGIAYLTVREMVDRYRHHLRAKHDEGWHRRNGSRLDYALAPLLELFGSELSAKFSPKRLKSVRHAMIASGTLCRGEINSRVSMQKKAFRWAASEELVPAAVSHGVDTLENLREGEYGVREGKSRGPVSEQAVFATLPYLHPVAAAIVELLWWTGARPTEIFQLRPRDIVRSGEVWTARLSEHKTSRKGKVRELNFGPNAQRVLRRVLDRVPAPNLDKPLFSPASAMADHYAERRAGRRTPLWSAHRRRYERERAVRERRDLAEVYTSGVLRNAISRAVTRANHEQNGDQIPRWTPYQIRHAALSRIRSARTLEAAKAVGGHATILMSENYTAQTERELARSVAAELG